MVLIFWRRGAGLEGQSWTFCWLSNQQHWKVYWNNLCRSFPNCKCSEFKRVFSKESWIDTKSHMSGIISESFINRPGLGRVHLRLQCFPGLGSKASWLWNNNVFFPCYFTYLFYRSLAPLSCSHPLCKLTWVPQKYFLFRASIVCAENEGTSLIILLLLIPLPPFRLKINHKQMFSGHAPVNIFVGHFNWNF